VTPSTLQPTTLVKPERTTCTRTHRRTPECTQTRHGTEEHRITHPVAGDDLASPPATRPTPEWPNYRKNYREWWRSKRPNATYLIDTATTIYVICKTACHWAETGQQSGKPRLELHIRLHDKQVQQRNGMPIYILSFVWCCGRNFTLTITRQHTHNWNVKPVKNFIQTCYTFLWFFFVRPEDQLSFRWHGLSETLAAYPQLCHINMFIDNTEGDHRCSAARC